MLVMKFGGTSVGDAKCFARVAEIVQSAKIEHKDLVVVVSAMSGVTDRLIDAARAAAEAMRQELSAGLEGQLLSPEEPFLGDLTLGDYLALPDAERARLWDEWAEEDPASWKEVDVLPDAMPG